MRAGKTSHKYEEEDVSKKHFPASETQEENETMEETEDPVRETNLSNKGIVDANVISTGEIKMAATKKDGADFSFIQFNSNFNEDFNEDFILKLPSQKKIHDLRWFGQQPTQTDFGDIYIEEKFESTERHKQTTEDNDYIYIFVEEVPSISMFLGENGYLASTIRNKNQEVELRYSILKQEHYVLGHVIIPEVLKLPPTLAGTRRPDSGCLKTAVHLGTCLGFRPHRRGVPKSTRLGSNSSRVDMLTSETSTVLGRHLVGHR